MASNFYPGMPRKNPTKEQTEQRRALVEKHRIGGCSIAETIRRIEEETGHKWSRTLIYADLVRIRKRWAEEAPSREDVREELQRMSRNIYQTAMERKRPTTRRELDKDGRLVITTVLVPDPDLKAANKTLETVAAMHGLKITKLEGGIGISGGLADFMHSIERAERKEDDDESDDNDEPIE